VIGVYLGLWRDVAKYYGGSVGGTYPRPRNQCNCSWCLRYYHLVDRATAAGLRMGKP
jgi:hypothetical protein